MDRLNKNRGTVRRKVHRKKKGTEPKMYPERVTRTSRNRGPSQEDRQRCNMGYGRGRRLPAQGVMRRKNTPSSKAVKSMRGMQEAGRPQKYFILCPIVVVASTGPHTGELRFTVFVDRRTNYSSRLSLFYRTWKVFCAHLNSMFVLLSFSLPRYVRMRESSLLVCRGRSVS